jgi:L-ascorbate metabolism protein UlaG (beta-lactamase superfamily)
MPRLARLSGGLLLGLAVLAAAAAAWLWSDRPDLDASPIPVAEPAAAGASAGFVTVTWLGVTTLLFDDGETRLLTDGFFSRPGLVDLVLDLPVAPDVATITRVLRESGIDHLDAVFTVHSHYDHAMDVGEVARQTGALVLGSASTANAARGAGLPEERIAVVRPGDSREIGRFRVSFFASRHAPLGSDGGPPFPGTIDAPLVPPAPVSAWREGGSFSIEIAHPRGTALVQGSAGFVEGALVGVRADVTFLGVGGLSRLGPAWTESYWREIVGRTGSTRVFPIHFDDFTRAYGAPTPYPRIVDDLGETFARLSALAAASPTPVRLARLPFRRAVVLF